jgi:hypothetical protein
MNKHPTKEEISIIKELSGPIGVIVLQWANVDRYLDYCIKIISEDHDTKNIINVKSLSPHSGKKISLLTQCFKEYTSLDDFEENGLALMKRAKSTSQERNKLIHSIFNGINVADRSINFQYLIRPKKELKYIIHEFTHNISTLLDLEKRIRDLAADIGHFGVSLREK